MGRWLQIPRTYAEIEIAQGRVEALQEDCHRQGEAGTFGPAPHADVQSPQTQTQVRIVHFGKPRRCPQSEADDSVSVRRLFPSRALVSRGSADLEFALRAEVKPAGV